MLAAAGHRQAVLKVPAPRLPDLTPDLAEHIKDLLEVLGGDHDAATRLRPGSWDLALDGGLLVELDEELHFNRYRGHTLQAPWANELPWTKPYLEYCNLEEERCLAAAKWGQRWTNPSCERMFGVASQPGDFDDGGGAPRWKQRALYDAVKDAFAMSQSEHRLARVSVHDIVDGTTLEQVLRTPTPEHGVAVARLVALRVA